MFSPDDTIVAVATPPGRGGLGVVRISGPEARTLALRILRCDRLKPRLATFTKVRGDEDASRAFDDVVVTWFPEPRSYTGQHVVEISAHGSPIVLEAIVRQAMIAGARLARPGEFTLRAFLSGKLDLVQAEAVADLIAAATPLQARVAFDQLEGSLTTFIVEIDARLLDLIAKLEASLDFPDEGYHFIEAGAVSAELTQIVERVDRILGDAQRGRMIRDGATVVITGRTNVGKSSLFNALVGHDRAIVTATPGTTRDLVTETIEIDGLSIRLVDTAGLRDAIDDAEREGVSRSVRARDVADVLLLVLDQSEPLGIEDRDLLGTTESRSRVVVANKVDRASSATVAGAIPVSAMTGFGIADLRRALIVALLGDDANRDTAAISNVRHVSLMEQARARLAQARDASAPGSVPEEFILADLHAARATFDEVLGVRTNEDVLRHIFERFCIGK